ncbi:hypothetical protein MXB_2546, partial [Myxobolus squamalis]
MVFMSIGHHDLSKCTPEFALQAFGYGLVADCHYSQQNFSYLFHDKKVEHQGCIRVHELPFSPVIEKVLYCQDILGLPINSLVAVCDLNRGIFKSYIKAAICTLVQAYYNEHSSMIPTTGYFEFGPHSAPLKALVQYYRVEEESVALRLNIMLKICNLPSLVERKYLDPFESIVLDSRRGFPFIVSIRPETSYTGIVGLYCSYTKISELCDIR